MQPNPYLAAYRSSSNYGKAPAATPPAPAQKGRGILGGLYDAFIGAPINTITKLPGTIVGGTEALGEAGHSILTGEHGAAAQASKQRAINDLKDGLFGGAFGATPDQTNAQGLGTTLEKIGGATASNVSNLMPFAPEGRLLGAAKGGMTVGKVAAQGAKIGAVSGAGQAMQNGGSLQDVLTGTGAGAGLGYLGGRVTGGVVNRLAKGKAFPNAAGDVGASTLKPTKVGTLLANAGTDLKARAGGYGIGEGRAGRSLGFYDSAQMDQNLRDQGIHPGSPDSVLKAIEDKMHGHTQAMDAILQNYNAPVDSHALAQEYLSTIEQQAGVSDTVRRSANNFANNLMNQVHDVRSLVNFRRGLDKQAISFIQNPDAKMAADQIASRVLREVANDHVNNAVPELAKVNQDYHNLATASDYVGAGSKVLSDMSQSGGGLYSRLVTGKSAQAAKSYAGAAMQRLGKMLGGAVPGEVAQSRAAQAVAALPEDHPALYVPGEPQLVSEQVPLQATDLRQGAQERVDQVTPRMVSRTTPKDALNLRRPAQEQVDTATPLNVRTVTPQGGGIAGMDGIVPADARPPAVAAQEAAQATPPPNSVDALAQPRVPSQAAPIDLRQASVPQQVPNPGTPIDLRTQPTEQLPTQVPGNVAPVDLRQQPTRTVQRLVPGEPVPVEPPPPAQANPLATMATVNNGRAGGSIGGSMPAVIATATQGDQSAPAGLADTSSTVGVQDATGGQPQQDQSPYGLANLEYDMSRDPKNSSTYMALYKMLNPSGNLSATMQRDLANINSAQNISKQLYDAYQQAGGGQGRISGAISNLLGKAGADNSVQVYNSIRAGSASKIARALGETGVLTDQDIARALGYLPQITDNPDEAARKMAFLDSVIAGAESSIQGRASGSVDQTSLAGVGQ